MKNRTNRYTYLFALALFGAGIGYLLYDGFTGGRMPFINVADLVTAPQGTIERAKIFGTVADDAITRPSNGLGANFTLLDKDNNALCVQVEYRGVLPDLFAEGAEVILEGRLAQDGLGETQVFQASTLSTKCPSKYEKVNRDDQNT